MQDRIELGAAYQAQLAEKSDRLTTLLAPFSAPALEVYPSPPEHYRMRAEFRVWHDGDDLYYVMFNPDTKEKYRVDQFAAANQLINTLMHEVLDYVRDKPLLRRKLFQVDFLTTTTNEALISLLYHRQLDDEWKSAAEQMRTFLQQFATVDLIGRARKQKETLQRDYVIENLTIHERNYQFEHIENSFTQPNAAVNTHMIEWACNVAKNAPGDLLELYCGNGNFSLPLASQFRHVLGTEISRSSVNSAKKNIALNGIENVRIERLSAEECSAAMKGDALPSRLQDMDLSRYKFSTVLVDPPRAGLDDMTVAMIAEFPAIIYVSCNPETLAENLEVLSKTHEITHAALFDQFPFTHHIEAGVYLQKKV
ncbi:tRNA (uridine(54)-C5)-methyltransferase TrmA [Aliidiomarina indica]|uniref:tRNA (uridine(54)-C5)-methyltransferase TrmA n=1 Tax=Aliidiomarina indica TaxID=2749147 RepID=UPI00188F3821|nr:tRNA (uridine(54)-C5)-methyltransferase TrmA [Aliidiomarina indica]